MTVNDHLLPIPSVALESQLTVITALKADDCIYMGADSEISDGSVRLEDRKLQWLTSIPLAWGYSGAVDPAHEFGEWLRALPTEEINDWRGFKDRATEAFSLINGKLRSSIRQAGRRPKPQEFAHVLIAGYIAGDPAVIEIENDGRSSLLPGQFTAIGSGSAFARIAYFTMRATIPPAVFDDQPKTIIRNATQIAARHHPDCGPPLRFLRISQDGIQPYDLNELLAG
jgi:ATP-dependent protease HslVU (ClpYQ) peptidase subunit